VVRIPVNVIPHDEYLKAIEKGDMLVCIPFAGKKIFEDNIIGKCAVCDCDIQFRPYNEKAQNKTCVSCANKFLVKNKR
jgi:hypothetical protein